VHKRATGANLGQKPTFPMRGDGDVFRYRIFAVLFGDLLLPPMTSCLMPGTASFAGLCVPGDLRSIGDPDTLRFEAGATPDRSPGSTVGLSSMKKFQRRFQYHGFPDVFFGSICWLLADGCRRMGLRSRSRMSLSVRRAHPNRDVS